LPTHSHKNFNASDIRRYLTGEMSAMEMHELESAALDDPFLADAIDGFRSQYGEHGKTLEEDVAHLHDRVTARANTAKVVAAKRPVWWSLAAVLILLAGAGMIVFSLLNNNPQESATLAQNENAAVESAEALHSTAGDSSEPEISAKLQRQASQKNEDSLSVQHQVTEDAAAPAAGAVEDRIVSAQAPVASTNERVTQEGFISARNRSLMDPAQNQAQELRGKVTDPEYRPIEGAEILANNNRVVTTSDRQGNFIIKSPDTAAEVQVNAEGYRGESVTLKGNAPPTPVILEQVASVETESVSNRMGKQKKAVATAVVEPIGGWQQFETYISRNKKQPQSGKYRSGEVHLAFSVNSKGRPVNISIKKPLSVSENAEAVRLLKEGPDWKVISSAETNATIVIKF
jgi:hypothetical protein